ncbi:MAG: hypothetical protein SF029_18050 [bacterium]|nr:hypothetical protein [bacterium]
MAKSKEPLRIGVIVGREWSWPPAFIAEVNGRGGEVIAEYVKLGGNLMNEPNPYRVIVDRISHEVPYYRSYLKNAALQGVKVVNDPFMWEADDKYFGASLVTQLGIASPRTVVLPNREYVPGIVPTESLRNLVYPMDWQALVDKVGGFPVVLKDAHGGGWRDVYVVHSMEELLWRYNSSGLLTMVLQEFIKWDDYARCMCLGQRDVHVMRYDPGARHYHEEHGFSPEMHDRLASDTLKICQAFGYDMNTAEFAIKDGVPYAIDFMNPAPDMDVNSLGRRHFEWMVTHMADEMIRLAKSKEATRDRYAWGKVGKSPKAKATNGSTTAEDVLKPARRKASKGAGA